MKTKYLGILVAAAVVGLSFGDALTGHGIKGNKNLNPLIVGDGSSGGSSSSSSSAGSEGCYEQRSSSSSGMGWEYYEYWCSIGNSTACTVGYEDWVCRIPSGPCALYKDGRQRIYCKDI